MQKIKHLLWFTLVELLVVITIVWILSTVGFVSYSGYLSGARDSNRISQLTKLSDSLQVYSASKSLPLPDDYIEIQASGSLIAYQGYVWVDVLETIDYTNWGTDPKDDTYYTYYLTRDRKSLQLMAMMEEQSSTAFHLSKSTNAINYEERYPKVYGKKLGVLTQDITNTPIQEVASVTTDKYIDIVNTNDSYTTNISDGITMTGTWVALSWLVWLIENKWKLYTCKDIKNGLSSLRSGIYTLYFSWKILEAYCDMETEWWGWTLIASDGNWINNTPLNVLSSIPSPTQAWMLEEMIEFKIREIANEMKIVSVSDHNINHTYDLSLQWLGEVFSLKNAEHGYLYSGINDWFSWWFNSPHKCNFSIVVIGNKWCTSVFDIWYPVNGKKRWWIGGSASTWYWSIPYSWQFKNNTNSFRLGWTSPSSYPNYYDERLASFLMIR